MSPFWFSVLASQLTVISGATTILFLLEELSGTQWWLVGCVCLWICGNTRPSVVFSGANISVLFISKIRMLISPLYSLTHPFLFLSPIFLIPLPILSFILSSLFPPYYKGFWKLGIALSKYKIYYDLKPGATAHRKAWNEFPVQFIVKSSPIFTLIIIGVSWISGRLPWDLALSSCGSIIIMVFNTILWYFSFSWKMEPWCIVLLSSYTRLPWFFEGQTWGDFDTLSLNSIISGMSVLAQSHGKRFTVSFPSSFSLSASDLHMYGW